MDSLTIKSLIRVPLLVFWAAVFAPFVTAQTPDTATTDVLQNESQDITDLLVLSGIQGAVEQLELAYSINLHRQSREYELSESQQALLQEAMAYYQSEKILAQLKAELADLLGENSAKPVLTTLRGEINQKFRRFERIQRSPQQQQKLADYLPNNPISEQRRNLLRACHAADFGPELSAILQSFAEVDTAVALDYISGEWISRNDAEGVKLWRRTIENDYAKQYAVKADPYLAFAYRFLRDERLEEYAALWDDRNMQWFMQTSMQSLRKILRAQRRPMLESLLQEEKVVADDNS